MCLDSKHHFYSENTADTSTYGNNCFDGGGGGGGGEDGGDIYNPFPLCDLVRDMDCSNRI